MIYLPKNTNFFQSRLHQSPLSHSKVTPIRKYVVVGIFMNIRDHSPPGRLNAPGVLALHISALFGRCPLQANAQGILVTNVMEQMMKQGGPQAAAAQ